MIVANLCKKLANHFSRQPQVRRNYLKRLVRAAGLEPARNFFQRILSPKFNRCKQMLGFRSLATLDQEVKGLHRSLANLFARSRPTMTTHHHTGSGG